MTYVRKLWRELNIKRILNIFSGEPDRLIKEGVLKTTLDVQDAIEFVNKNPDYNFYLPLLNRELARFKAGRAGVNEAPTKEALFVKFDELRKGSKTMKQAWYELEQWHYTNYGKNPHYRNFEAFKVAYYREPKQPPNS